MNATSVALSMYSITSPFASTCRCELTGACRSSSSPVTDTAADANWGGASLEELELLSDDS